MKEGIDFELDNTCESDFDGESSTDNLTIISRGWWAILQKNKLLQIYFLRIISTNGE